MSPTNFLAINNMTFCIETHTANAISFTVAPRKKSKPHEPRQNNDSQTREDAGHAPSWLAFYVCRTLSRKVNV